MQSIIHPPTPELETGGGLHPTELESKFIEAARGGHDAEADRLASLIDAEQQANEQRLTTPGALLNAALWYAGALGWPVFPCIAGGKRPATTHGFKDASTDVTQIRRWWTDNPMYNIGIPTGVTFDVFDIDGPQGLIAVGEHFDAGTFPPIYALSLTPRGRHYLVPPTDLGNTTGLLPQVDYRSSGGYIVAPPSATPDGTYRWSIPPTVKEAA